MKTVREVGMFALSCVFGTVTFGQGGTASITGTITDPSGSVISGAAVEATNRETGVVYSAATTTAGNYTVPNLPVGTYSLTVKVTGFKTYTHANGTLIARFQF